MTNSAVAGTFVDIRSVPSRKVVRLVLEFPVEQGAELVELFGYPQPDNPRWVGVAPLVGNPHDRPAFPPAEQVAPPRERQPVERAPLDGWERDRQRAVMLCKDPRFQAWRGCATEQQAIDSMRAEIGGSRSLIATDPDIHRQFLAVETTYRLDCGLMAARR